MKYSGLSLVVSLVLCSSTVIAQNTNGGFPEDAMAISYDTGAGIEQTDGTSKAETYDVAIKLQDNSLVGKQIVGLRIPIINSDGLANLSGWLSAELKLEEVDGTNVNAPSITSKTVEANSGWTEIVFDKAYEITSEGVYAGYTFDVVKTNNQNLNPIATTSEVSQWGYYLRTSRTRKYKEWYCPYDANEDKGSLRMQVMVSGMDGDAASVALYPVVNAQAGNEFVVPATLYCHGFNGIKSIDYEYESGVYKGQGSVQLETPVEASYNKFANVNLPINPISDLGERTFSVKITKVNGKENQDNNNTATCTVYIFDFVPKHIPLVEEYSGTWCGNCVRGIASMELMKKRHGEDFICLTYHNNDEMALSITYPSEIRGFPDCWIDRTKNTDPFFGDRSDGLYHFEEEWELINLAPSSVGLELSVEWADEEQTLLKAAASLRSQKEYFDNELSMAFVLLADDLYGENWRQLNYYANDETCEELAEMASQPYYIFGLHYNDVVISCENIDGAKLNLPDNIKPMTDYEVSHTFDITKAVNSSGTSLVQDKNKLKVVVFVLNTVTGKVENAYQSSYMESDGMHNIVDNDSHLIDVKYYNHSGILIKNPAKGVYLRRAHYSDGQVITGKAMLN